MPSFKAPTFEERAQAAREAKQRALEKLKDRPVMDEAEAERRRQAREAKEAAEAEKRRLKREAEQAAKEAAREAKRIEAARIEAERAEAAAAALAAKFKPQKSDAELKAARDARYAARKQKRK